MISKVTWYPSCGMIKVESKLNSFSFDIVLWELGHIKYWSISFLQFDKVLCREQLREEVTLKCDLGKK